MADIYGLIDAYGELRYIGKANDCERRMENHMREIGRRKFPLYAWLAKHGRPTMLVLESSCEDWRLSEREWIAAARFAGVPLLNLADGGDEPLCTREQRQANARKTIAKGYGFTSEQAKRFASATNEKMRNDPKAREIREMKRYFAAHIKTYGFTPKRLAKLFYCAQRAPHIFGSWFDRLTDKYLKPLTENEYEEFISEVGALCAR